tara:strand:- start:32 stop:706 length:675 start_codon:yes stop_codon:yes gene_type:complete
MAFIIDGTTGIATVDGSVSAPSQRGQDSNSGISYAADTIKFSTNGVERMAITNSGITGITAGITHARIYRITSTFSLTSGSATLTSNWEYEDDASAGNLGSGWSLPSSGVFSFPTTGIYMVKGHTMINAQAGTNMPYGGLSLQGTTDNFSSIDYRSDAYSSQSDDLNQVRYHNVHLGAMFDVTDTSNVKFKLLAYRDVNYGNISFAGSSDHNYTYVEVIRLGDT